MVAPFPVLVGWSRVLGTRRRVMLVAMKGLIGRPILIEKMDAELVPNVVQAIIDDNERAKRAREERRRRKRRGRPAADRED